MGGAGFGVRDEGVNLFGPCTGRSKLEGGGATWILVRGSPTPYPVVGRGEGLLLQVICPAVVAAPSLPLPALRSAILPILPRIPPILLNLSSPCLAVSLPVKSVKLVAILVASFRSASIISRTCFCSVACFSACFSACLCAWSCSLSHSAASILSRARVCCLCIVSRSSSRLLISWS